MRAAVLAEPRRSELCETRLPEPATNQVLVRVQGCGVCASNIPPWEGKPWFQYPMAPGALGHEAWGIIERVGARVREFAVGDRVGMISQHGFAEFDVAEANALVRLPSLLHDEPFPAEPLGCALNIFKRSAIQRDETVAIIGIGFLGALLTQLAAAAGARVIAISRRRFALELARQFGAGQTIEGSAAVVERAKQFTGDRLCDVVIEAAGKQLTLDLAAELMRERGRLVIAGYHQDGLRQVNMQLWNWRGLDVINAHERDPQICRAGMEAAVEAVASGLLDPRALYTHRFSLDEIGEAFAMAATRPDGFIKALVLMQ
jgi:2-desacetyl-2-hydroxyethyl bacteriochlorophyllide A dehydrogenase